MMENPARRPMLIQFSKGIYSAIYVRFISATHPITKDMRDNSMAGRNQCSPSIPSMEFM